MSSTTWTPSALRSERCALAQRVWRVVEAQHRVSTTRLTDNIAEQEALERLLEDSKPPYPPACARLDYLLKTPFRYLPPPRQGSRFRRADDPRGVFYAAEAKRTALAEAAFYRLLFFAGAPGLRLPARPLQHTLFAISYRTAQGLDLSRPPLNRDHAQWTRRDDYAPCQALVEQARSAEVEAIRYVSVRDREPGMNVALLVPTAFTQRAPKTRETWTSVLRPQEVLFYRASGDERQSFERAFFCADPRLRSLCA